jgi:hypothetical protein
LSLSAAVPAPVLAGGVVGGLPRVVVAGDMHGGGGFVSEVATPETGVPASSASTKSVLTERPAVPRATDGNGGFDATDEAAGAAA